MVPVLSSRSAAIDPGKGEVPGVKCAISFVLIRTRSLAPPTHSEPSRAPRSAETGPSVAVVDVPVARRVNTAPSNRTSPLLVPSHRYPSRSSAIAKTSPRDRSPCPVHAVSVKLGFSPAESFGAAADATLASRKRRHTNVVARRVNDRFERPGQRACRTRPRATFAGIERHFIRRAGALDRYAAHPCCHYSRQRTSRAARWISSSRQKGTCQRIIRRGVVRGWTAVQFVPALRSVALPTTACITMFSKSLRNSWFAV